MTIEEKAHTAEVAIAYAGSGLMLALLVALTLWQARRARDELARIEGRDG